MRIIPTSRTVDPPAGNIGDGPRQAVVPIAAAPADACLRIARPDARFVTQLIATAAHVPQTRAQRRAEIADGVTVYGEVATMTEPQRAANGRTLSRVA